MKTVKIELSEKEKEIIGLSLLAYIEEMKSRIENTTTSDMKDGQMFSVADVSEIENAIESAKESKAMAENMLKNFLSD